METLDDIDRYLLDVRQRASMDDLLSERACALLRDIKADAVASDDQRQAKLCWCYETILHIQDTYLSAFKLMREASYFQAWCALERVEIGLEGLAKHFSPNTDDYALRFIETHTCLFQSLYPYRYFCSVEMLHIEEECSICGKRMSIRTPCGHRTGEIYDGELCMHEITKGQVLGVAIVEHPAHKYAVLFPKNSDSQSEDPYDYGLVEYVITGLRAPFDEWSLTRTHIRYPHSHFQHIGPSDPCPCESGKTYAECCLRETGVLKPHIQVAFSVTPPSALSLIRYSRQPKASPPTKAGDV